MLKELKANMQRFVKSEGPAFRLFKSGPDPNMETIASEKTLNDPADVWTSPAANVSSLSTVNIVLSICQGMASLKCLNQSTKQI